MAHKSNSTTIDSEGIIINFVLMTEIDTSEPSHGLGVGYALTLGETQKKEIMSYYFKKNSPLSMADTEAKLREALKEQGFGILTEIDLAATFAEKLERKIAPHKILGACNPQFAFQATEAEPQISSLLPCNISLRETTEGTEVVVLDPESLFALVERPEIAPLATEVKGRLTKALAAL